MQSKLLLYANTIKYLKPVQVYGRLVAGIKKYFPHRLPETPAALIPSLNPKTNFIFHDPWNSYKDLRRNKFCFLNHSIDFGGKINWKPDAGLLWKFNLHYFNYLFLLSNEEQIKLCREWIKGNDIGEEPGWHPYPLSLRITNWCKADLKDELILESLYTQTAFLFRNLEYYHPANHYLENARGLIFAGLYFNNKGEANIWLEKGLSIIRTELPKQILPDGGYFEKSIMYHSLILELVLDLLNILPEASGVYSLLLKSSEKMMEFLKNLTHPDGNISLFSDSAEEIAPLTGQLEKYGERLGIEIKNSYSHASLHSCIHAFNDSGFYIFKNNDIYLAIDGGSIGPDFIPAHAHADIFSYELSIKEKKFISDSGVYEYKPGEFRDYARSTKAHNTLTIDGKSQAELWGSFRAARRFPPEEIRFEEKNGGIIFTGRFTGYSNLIGDNLIHTRNILYEPETAILSVEDLIQGKGRHLSESFIHLHPEVKIIESGTDLFLEKEEAKIKFTIKEAGFRIDDGAYFPQFGKKIGNKVIVLFSERIPAAIKYSLQLIKKG
ncbi:MAG: heparinase II/III family protein [Ignavibacteria bacterium]